MSQPLNGARDAAAYIRVRTNPPVTPQLVVVDEYERPRVERFIGGAYHSAYGARIVKFMPELAVVRRGEDLLAACGLRRASGEPLFLEKYLDEPVERALTHSAGQTVARAGVVEVGNLAIERAGAARLLIALLTTHLAKAGTEWVVFTAVAALRNNFLRLRIPMHALGAADPARLPVGERSGWGRYYEHAPQLIAVRVADSRAALTARE